MVTKIRHIVAILLIATTTMALRSQNPEGEITSGDSIVQNEKNDSNVMNVMNDNNVRNDSIVGDSVVGDSIVGDSVKAVAKRVLTPKSSPVDVDDQRQRPVMHYFDKHGDPLDEPVMFLSSLDTVVKKEKKFYYPIYSGVNIGANFGDLIFKIFGQDYSSYDVWANVSIRNQFFPTLECGIGFANSTPDHGNFTYRCKPSFYAKIGADYNFFMRSDPGYQFHLGFRVGFAHSRYDLKNVTINSDYWGESQGFTISDIGTTCVYGEILAGLQVKIVKNFSLGWTARMHFRLHETETGYGKAWYVPGYGGNGAFGFSMSAIWSIPSKQAKEAYQRAQEEKKLKNK